MQKILLLAAVGLSLGGCLASEDISRTAKYTPEQVHAASACLKNQLGIPPSTVIQVVLTEQCISGLPVVPCLSGKFESRFNNPLVQVDVNRSNNVSRTLAHEYFHAQQWLDEVNVDYPAAETVDEYINDPNEKKAEEWAAKNWKKCAIGKGSPAAVKATRQARTPGSPRFVCDYWVPKAPWIMLARKHATHAGHRQWTKSAKWVTHLNRSTAPTAQVCVKWHGK